MSEELVDHSMHVAPPSCCSWAAKAGIWLEKQCYSGPRRCHSHVVELNWHSKSLISCRSQIFTMNVQRPTYMLLPDFGRSPGDEIHLGTLLALSSKTQLPDPDVPLNAEERMLPPDAQVKRHSEHAWVFDNSTQSCWSAGLEADVPVFLPAGGGISYGIDKKQGLRVECELVATERFIPSQSYIAEALSADFIKAYCRRKWRPSVYLVTGLKTATNATITSTTSSLHNGKAEVKLDATSLGVPLSAGPSLDASTSGSARTESHVEGPFLLAYQLKRLRLSSKGAIKSVDGFNKFALLDDEEIVNDVGEGEAWDIEDVQPGTLHDA